ncbi:hypothetical protein [Desulfovibrio litoralis]|uniref:Uncharacterized protein n=1 Tax=Desulfovibrio litoralis DSM 11393 TaxID=1121455 RepID=A0A1M7S5X2_9BACT|nr:hypothetical protein [Desulfovibrio litoralis]SHN53858.1 hypothetical protein SAMN02745728_00463 [Desulfovibrio litoralis DSM 11393]
MNNTSNKKTDENKILVRSVNQFGDEILRESNAKGAYYNVIEVKEHQLLLNLYYACYTSCTQNNEHFPKEPLSALKACNRFFAGEI